MSGEVFYGRSVCQSEGSRTAEGIVGRWTADGLKFLLRARKLITVLDLWIVVKEKGAKISDLRECYLHPLVILQDL